MGTSTLSREILDALERGEFPDHARLDKLGPWDRERLLDALLIEPAGRRWLRGMPALDATLAAHLLAHTADYRGRRRDRSLERPVLFAPVNAVVASADALAAGPAAPAMWLRLREEGVDVVSFAFDIVSGRDEVAAETTLMLLVSDPLDPFHLGEDRARVALSGMGSPFGAVRGQSAEYVALRRPEVLLSQLDRLSVDDEERVRGVVWASAFQLDPTAARERALELLGDESQPIDVRRSALVAVGEHRPTADVSGILTYFVGHSDPLLAGDAADLLYRHHRDPQIADAASRSVHEHVRDTAARLLDPLRGSPAAGGSRPGDPTRGGDIFAEMLRRLESDEAPPVDQESPSDAS